MYIVLSLYSFSKCYCKTTGTQGIVHAVVSQKLSEKFPYFEDYIVNMKGHAPSNVAIAYPETEIIKKADRLASKVKMRSMRSMRSKVRL